MSLASSLTNTVRSATYNPEAEKAFAEEREKAAVVRKEIEQYLDSYDKYILELTSKGTTPAWTIKEMERLSKESRGWLTSNSEANETTYKNKQGEIIKRGGEIISTGNYLFLVQSWERIMKFTLETIDQKKLLGSADRKTYEDFYKQIQRFNASNTSPNYNAMKVFFDKLYNEVKKFSQSKGIWDQQQQLAQAAQNNPQKFEADISTLETQAKEVKQEEEKKFSVQRFAKRVTGTAVTVVGSLLYVTFCLVIGMLAANEAIGRAPAYRVLYFIYGAIFAPVLVFYYLYLWFKDKSPKIYTLLPLSQMVPETTIGRFFLFPFLYKEDKSAREKLVEFMTQSAEMVGKTFDPKSLGSIGQQVETVAENLKKISPEDLAKQLPTLDSLRINRLPNLNTAKLDSA